MMERYTKENHIASFPSNDDQAEEEEGKPRQHMMIKGDLKSSVAMSSMASIISNSNSPVMSLLDIMRDSSTLLRLNFSALMWVMLILIFPLSALLLSASSLRKIRPIASMHHVFNLQIYNLASALGILHSSFFKSLYFPLSNLIVSYLLCSPLFLTTWLLAKAFTIFTISSTYSSRKPSLKVFTSIAFKLWKRLLYTFFCIICAFVALFLISTLILCVLTTTLTALKLPADLILLAQTVTGILGSVLLAHMLIIATLATVVCILEDHIGTSCVMRCVHLIRGRRQVALSLVLTSTLCTAMVETLYEHRVIGVAGGSYKINTASRLWEAPLLIFIYSFLYLYHAVICGVFYFTCKSAAMEHQDTTMIPADNSEHTIPSVVTPTSLSGLDP